MTSENADLVRAVDRMPDIVKLAICGLALDPPTIDLHSAPPMYVMVLDQLVELGAALVIVGEGKRSYRLTLYGVELYEEVATRTPSDGSLPANDLDAYEPEPAA